MSTPAPLRPRFRQLLGALAPLLALGGCSSRSAAPPRDATPVNDAATDQAIFASWWSNTVLGNPAHDLTGSSVKETVTYRSYVPPHTAAAARWRFWTSNGTDSTYGSGASGANRAGGSWRIDAAYVGDGGTAPTGAVEPGSMRAVLFDGEPTKDVQPGERFWSDAVEVSVPDGHLLAFTWTISTFGVASPLPFAHASIVSTFSATGAVARREEATGFAGAGDKLVAPQVFATQAPASAKRLCFLGDSITQGIGSSKDSYAFWVARIAAGLGPEVAVWNLGSGWARAADAATDGYWLYKAKQCPEIVIALGVNDLNVTASPVAAVLLETLNAVVAALRAHRPDARISMLTVAPFGYAGAKYQVWKTVNDAIRNGQITGVDRVFDIGTVLSRPAPDDGLVKTEYMTGGDWHPNDAASAAIAEAFLAWYRAP